MEKHSAQVYPLAGRGTVVVKQLVKRPHGRYVIDGQRERHVPLDDDRKLATAIRDAMAGRLREDEGTRD
jgi:hypothetical protein